jgi:hypothetical protein
LPAEEEFATVILTKLAPLFAPVMESVAVAFVILFGSNVHQPTNPRLFALLVVATAFAVC